MGNDGELFHTEASISPPPPGINIPAPPPVPPTSIWRPKSVNLLISLYRCRISLRRRQLLLTKMGYPFYIADSPLFMKMAGINQPRLYDIYHAYHVPISDADCTHYFCLLFSSIIFTLTAPVLGPPDLFVRFVS